MDRENCWYWIAKSLFLLVRMISKDYFPRNGITQDRYSSYYLKHQGDLMRINILKYLEL